MYSIHVIHRPGFTGLGRSVLGKNVLEVSSTSGTVFPNTERPRQVNNIFIYFLILFLEGRRNY